MVGHRRLALILLVVVFGGLVVGFLILRQISPSLRSVTASPIPLVSGEPAVTPRTVASPIPSPAPAVLPEDVTRELPAFCEEVYRSCSGPWPSDRAAFCQEACALCGNCAP